MTDMQAALGDAVFEHLPRHHDTPELARFYALLRDYPERGGKRLRGLLVLTSLAAHGGDWSQGLGVAAALELFQNWVLIHDDIEDDSEDRRGKAALHRLVGMPVALNVGDALHVAMWGVLHSIDTLPPTVVQEVLAEFGWMILRTAEGQHLDLSFVAEGRFDVGEAEYLAMVTLKAAYYTVVCPLRLGAICAGRSPDPALREAGVELGVAFQIRDDVLNLMPDAVTGKEFAGDLYEAKRTLILGHLFAHANPAEQSEVTAILGKPRADKQPHEVARVLAFIDHYGSLAYAQGVAQTRAQRGLTKLRDVLATLPGREEAGEIARLLESLASRRR